MPAFEYSALNARGKTEKGVLEGDSSRQISQKLKKKSLIPLEIVEISRTQNKKANRVPFLKRGISTSQLAILTRQLATMIRSGSPVEGALTAVIQQTSKPRVKSVLMAIRSRVREGYSLASALDEFPHIFPDLYRATVASGEQSGKLDFVLVRMADHVENSQALHSKIMLAMVYPLVLTFVAILVTVVLLTYVVPKVIQVFEDIDQTLPGITIFLIAMSDFLRNYGLYIAVLIAVAVTIFNILLQKESFKLAWHTLLLRIPGVAHLVKGMNTAIFARTFSILAGSGVNALQAMRISADVMSNLRMKKAVLDASERVREGAGISPALEKSKCFPPMTIYLIASGESSGNLVEMLEHAANSQEKEFEIIISTIMGLFEPLLIVVMGGVVLFIVIAILLPIFQLNQLVGA
ncbi:MAG: type II secretion system inner membrane protein GspF [Gammaproteobacteria bacterium]|nr:type II secretion system inner membrane protein GspF [Gammaproteobacteria bacterium]